MLGKRWARKREEDGGDVPWRRHTGNVDRGGLREEIEEVEEETSK